MADLIRVRFTSGTESVVSAEYIARWPEDIDSILEPTDAPAVSTPEPTPAKESPKSVAPAKEKK